MTQATPYHLDLAKAFVHTYIFGQNHQIAEDIILDNSISNVTFGMCFNREMLVAKSQIWKNSFKLHTLNACHEMVTDDCAVYQLNMTGKHIGEFKSLPATGKDITFNTTAMINLGHPKISRVCISTNVKSIMEQISENNPFAHGRPDFIDNPNSFDNVVDVIKLALKPHDIELTKHSIAHLCLWVIGKSNSDAAIIIGRTPKTAQYFQNVLKYKFSCFSKAQLALKVDYLNLRPLLTEGFVILTCNSPTDNKKMLGQNWPK